jgi:hypothetical protein
MGKCLEQRGVRREVVYIQTQNYTPKGSRKNNGKVFRETRVMERSAIHSDTELYAERMLASRMGKYLEKRSLRREERNIETQKVILKGNRQI